MGLLALARHSFDAGPNAGGRLLCRPHALPADREPHRVAELFEQLVRTVISSE